MGTRCGRCDQEVERAALSRCRDARCPLTRRRGTESIRALAGYSVAVAGILLGVGKIAYVSVQRGAVAPDQPVPVATGPTTISVAVASPDATHSDAPRESWFSRLWHAPAPVAEPPPEPTGPDPSRPDPGAATRVMSFHCGDALSSSRALICTHWNLATADYNLMLSYRAALAHSTHRAALRRERAAWLRQLDTLNGDPARVQRHIETFQNTLAAS